jgi:hypothetical protein
VTEDPEDVYRVWLPAHRTLLFTVKGDSNVSLEVWNSKTRTVHERGGAARRDLLGISANPGTQPETVRVTNSGATGRIVYADVFLAKDVNDATYTLTVRPV